MSFLNVLWEVDPLTTDGSAECRQRRALVVGVTNALCLDYLLELEQENNVFTQRFNEER